MNHQCLGCNKMFIKKYDFKRHVLRKNPCVSHSNLLVNTIIRYDIKVKDLELKIKQLEDKLVNICKTINISGDNNITNSNNTNITIQLIKGFGHENTNHIHKNLIYELLVKNQPIDSLINLYKSIYHHDNVPENHIIRKKGRGLEVYQDSEWHTKDIEFIRGQVLNKIVNIIDNRWSHYASCTGFENYGDKTELASDLYRFDPVGDEYNIKKKEKKEINTRIYSSIYEMI